LIIEIYIFLDCWNSEPENRPAITHVLDQLKSTIENFGNEFGGRIKFREGAPIQLLEYKQTSEKGKFGQIVLNPEALNALKDIPEPLAIISVGKQYIEKVNLDSVT
jgi:hypothetical protein